MYIDITNSEMADQVSGNEEEWSDDEINDRLEELTCKVSKTDTIKQAAMIKALARYGLPPTAKKEEIKQRLIAESQRRRDLNKQKDEYKQTLEVLHYLEKMQHLPAVKEILVTLKKHMPDLPLPKKLTKLIGTRNHYNTIEKVLVAVNDTDIVVFAANRYIVCANVEDFNVLINKLATYQDTEYKQLIKGDMKQKTFFIVKTKNEEIIAKLKQTLLLHYKDRLTDDAITVVPYNHDTSFIVLESIWGTFNQNRADIAKLIIDPPMGHQDSVADIVIPQSQLMDATSYIFAPIIKDMLPQNIAKTGMTIHIHIHDNHISTYQAPVTINEAPKKKKKKTKEERASLWITRNPPETETVRVYYDTYKEYYVKKQKSFLNSRKFNDVMEEDGYVKKIITRGTIWINENESDKESDDE